MPIFLRYRGKMPFIFISASCGLSPLLQLFSFNIDDAFGTAGFILPLIAPMT